MRFLCIYRPGYETDAPPTQEESEKMGKFIGEMQQAGVLLAAEGCMHSAKGVRVRSEGSSFSVTDGPFPETKELIAGFCLMQVKSKAEAVEWGKRFLNVAGGGETEIRLLHDMPAANLPRNTPRTRTSPRWKRRWTTKLATICCA